LILKTGWREAVIVSGNLRSEIMEIGELTEKLNKALAWELRAINMYAHYSAYVKGIHRLHLSAHFKQESDESLVHADTVRCAIAKLGGIAITERDQTPIIHSTSYKEMLEQALQTEIGAAKTYGDLLKIIEENGDKELYDSIEAIYFAEVRSVEEMRMLMA
jgi:bacterioferritin